MGFPSFSVLLTSQIGILLPRRDQSRADGAGGTGESLRCPIVSPYLNTLLIFKMSDTSFFTPSRRSLWCVPFLFFGSFSTLRKFRRNCLCLFAAKFDSKILLLTLSSKLGYEFVAHLYSTGFPPRRSGFDPRVRFHISSTMMVICSRIMMCAW
jgi:hypothetical protein